jgi:hypothetical protein
MGFRGAELPAVRMSGYVAAARASREVARAARAEGLTVPPMLLDTVWPLPLHPVTPDQVHDCALLAARLRQLNAAYWQDEVRRKAAADTGESEGQYSSGAILDEDQDGTLGSRFLYAFWRLCEQRIAAQQAVPTGHSAQVTAAKAAVPPEVRVVALRRTGSPARRQARRERTSGNITGWYACTRSGSGTPACSSTRWSTAGPSSRAIPASRCSAATSCEAWSDKCRWIKA